MEEPISLYLELEPGTVADLEVVAQASLAFAAAIREIAFVLDPSIEVSLKLASGTEGSLSLNTIVRTVKERLTDRRVLSAIGFTALAWFGTDVRQYIVGQGLEKLLKSEKKISPEEIKEISEAVLRALDGRVAERNVQDVYRQLQRDPAVKGVGATQEPGRKPEAIVPRSEFSKRLPIEETVVELRVREQNERVTLISPVLLPGDRRWRFSFHEGEFGAPIKDERFLDDVLSGRYPLVMRNGIEMDVVLQTKEEKELGVWVVKDRTILKVHRTYPAPMQEHLDLPKAAIEPKGGSGED